MKLERILVPTDYSPHAARALELALSFAEHFDARIELLHVYQVPAEIYPYSLYITDEHLKQIEERQEAQMKELCEAVQKRGASVEGRVVRGETFDIIPKLVKEQEVDLIILGTRGNTGLPHILLGSTAERTIRLAPCPVIAVPAPPEDSK